jgi:hypothetical protein
MRILRLESRLAAVRSAFLSALLASALLAVAFAPAASADVGEKIILRCTHGESLSGFSQSQYRQALKDLSADSEEYSGCSLEIREAELAASGSHGGGSAGSGGQSGAAPAAVAATPAEQRAIAHAEQSDSEPVKLSGGIVHPGVVHVDVASALSSLPTSLLVTLAFLLACLLLVFGGALRKRVRARGSD